MDSDGISLQLRNLTSSDFGIYVCEVLVAEGTEFDNQAVDIVLEEAGTHAVAADEDEDF